MRSVIKNFWPLLKHTVREWNAKDPFRQSAVIAYYAIFSIPGLLVLIIAIAGYFFGKDVVSQHILEQISRTMGANTAQQISEVLIQANSERSTLFGTIVGLAILLLGATGVFIELQKTLNIIWHVESVTKKGIWPILKARLFSFGLIMAIAFLLLISLVVSALITALTSWLHAGDVGFWAAVFHVINFLISLAVISFLFALMYKILPDAKIEMRHVWLGAVLTGLLFTIGKTALALYFEKANPGSAYGAASSIILILLWVSYSSMILFFGAEFTYLYTKTFSRVQPSEIAVKTDPHKQSLV
ncbi:MAG TPA: YihY/virulence factor BrkB family protein [Cytophagaceae bacterium]|nr:YihY/virulence factor BrkB family protein [Cytophagaceae bacterium]